MTVQDRETRITIDTRPTWKIWAHRGLVVAAIAAVSLVVPHPISTRHEVRMVQQAADSGADQISLAFGGH